MFKVVSLIFAALAITSAAEARNNDAPGDRDGWFDITVLKGHVRPDWTLKSFDQVENCDKTQDEWLDEGRAGRSHLEAFDCTRYIEGRTNATVFKPLPKWTFRNGYLTSPQRLDSPLIEIYTVVPLDRMERADFLGFSESYLGGRVNLFKANGADGKTHESGQVRLKDGRIGIVHRWIAEFQQTGWGAGIVMRNVPFKPVLARNAGGDLLRYWDNLQADGLFTDYQITNYRNTGTGSGYEQIEPTVIDRSEQLLLQ